MLRALGSNGRRLLVPRAPDPRGSRVGTGDRSEARNPEEVAFSGPRSRPESFTRKYETARQSLFQGTQSRRQSTSMGKIRRTVLLVQPKETGRGMPRPASSFS